VRAYWSAKARAPQLSVLRQLLEMALLYLLRRIGPGYYLQARWGRASIPFHDKWRHANRAEYRRVVEVMNPAAYHKSSQHKLIEKSVLTLQGIPTPRFVAYVHPERGRSADGTPIRSPQQLNAVLASQADQLVCFKLVEGWGGSGFSRYRISVRAGQVELLRHDGIPAMSVAQWWEKFAGVRDGYLVEAYQEQHPSLAALNASSLNTLRLWVVIGSAGPRVLGGYLRVGRAGSAVDNISSGGIVGRLDVERGEVCEVFDPLRPGTALSVHPDSQIQLEGMRLPFWEECKVLASEAVLAFPQMRLAGLDVAIADSGPRIIELNVVADYIGCAWMDLPLKDVLDLP